MAFTLQIETDGAAFEDDGELPRLLRQAAADLEQARADGVLVDINGNTCGSWQRSS